MGERPKSVLFFALFREGDTEISKRQAIWLQPGYDQNNIGEHFSRWLDEKERELGRSRNAPVLVDCKIVQL